MGWMQGHKAVTVQLLLSSRADPSMKERRSHIASLLDEPIMDEEGQGVLHSKVQLLPKALLQVRLTGVIQLALRQRYSCAHEICQAQLGPPPKQSRCLFVAAGLADHGM